MKLDLLSLILSIIVSLIPIILVGIPYLLMRKFLHDRLITKMYGRTYLGFVIFNFLYFIVPSLMNVLNPPPNDWANTPLYAVTHHEWYEWLGGTTYDFSTVWQPDMVSFIKYAGHFTANSLVMFLQYPIIILPFVFIVAPIISFGILAYRIRSRDKDLAFTEKLKLIQYELETGPRDQIYNRLSETSWKNEKELFQALVSVLPISLYLLMAFLSWLQYEEKASILQGTSLGWFLEIFFVYLATVIFAVHLLYSTKFSYKGRFIGKNIRTQMVQSLSTVGAFISLIAITLFILQYSQQIWTVVYFCVYFIMAVSIFILILDIFEPFSVILLIKMVEFFKTRPKLFKTKLNKEKTKQFTGNFFKMAAFGLLIHLVTMIIIFILELFLGAWHGANYWADEHQLFYHTSYQLVFILIAGLSIYVSRRFSWRPMMNGSIIYLMGILIIPLQEFYYLTLNDPLSLVQSAGGRIININPLFAFIIQNQSVEHSWITSIFRKGSFYNISNSNLFFFIPELESIDVVFADILGIFSLPYYYLNYWGQIVLFSLVFFYLGLNFITSTQRVEDETMAKNIFSEQIFLPSAQDIKLEPKRYIIVRNFEKTYPDDPPEFIKEIPKRDRQIQSALENYDMGKKLIDYIYEDPVPITEFCTRADCNIKELLDFFKKINKLELGKAKPFSIYTKEYGYTYEEVRLDSLHIMMVDGRACFVHEFVEETDIEPALVSGLFAAITSFAKEAVKSEEALRSIDHGDTFLTIEYGDYVFGAIFSSGESAVVRKRLRLFLDTFEEKHGDELPNWLGDMSIFDEDEEIVEEIFYVETPTSETAEEELE